MQLRPYQIRVLDELDAWFRENPDGNPIVHACVGAGKSVMLAEFCRRAVLGYPGYRARLLMLVPSKELAEQNFAKLAPLAKDVYLGVVSAALGRKDRAYDKDVVLATVGSVAKNPGQLGRLDLILIDECFPKGTKILTESGELNIEDIKPGDKVLNALGQGVVKAMSNRQAEHLLEVKFSNGNKLIVTEKHPVFTASGWKSAEKLEVGEDIFSLKDMRFLRETVLSMDKTKRRWINKKRYSRVYMEQAKLLLNILLEESEQSDEQQSGSNENEGIAEKDKASAYKEGREWTPFNASAIGLASRIRGWMGIGSRNTDKNSKRKRLSDLLQAGYCKSDNENRNRDRRIFPLWREERYRCEKGRLIDAIRVESVSRVEQESPEPVFNLHVSGHPSYFANGILVHNCHLASRKETGQYRQLIAACRRYNPSLRVVGWTGTPYRGDGVWLTEGTERLFADIAARATMRELLDEGYLAPLATAQTGIQVDAEGVKMRDGDFVVGELAKRLDESELIDAIVGQIVELGKDRKRWLVYGVTVEHAVHLAEAIRARGVEAAVVSAQTPVAVRAAVVRDFKAGRLRCICNVAVLTTGFDVPELDLIALVRNTRSPVLYTQIAGRGMRVAEGKTDCLWLDFTDTTAVMGPVDRVKGRAEPKPTQKGDGAESFAPTKACDDCGKSVPTAIAACPACGHAFPPPRPAVNETVSAADVLDKVGFHAYPVFKVTYHRHVNRKNPDAPPTLKVSYWSGMKLVCSEWVCLEHTGYARAKAEKWWAERFAGKLPLPCPNTVEQALTLTDWLKTPAGVVVREGDGWPELVRCVFGQADAFAKNEGNNDF